MRHALALAVLRQFSDAANWARAALIQAAKAWVAARGETYLEPKWLPQQMERVPDSELLTGRFWSLESAVETDDGYIRACADLVAELGVGGCAAEPERVYVDRAAGVTTWGGVDRLHVVRSKQDVFALGPQAAAVWRSIVFARPLSQVVAGTGMDPARAGAFLAEFHRLGLLRLRWRGAGTITPAQPFSPSGPITPAPSTSRPILGPGGALPGPAGEEIILLPLPAQRFAVATLAMVWANMMLENAREDLVGALKGQQWRVAELTARRMLQHACRGILSAYGAVPLPPDSDVVLRLGSLADLPPQVKAMAHELDGGLRVGSAEEGTALLAALDGFVREVRTLTGATLFPACFDDLEQWTQALEVAYDWIRLGAYLNAEFPVDEGRDLLESRGRQPRLSAAGDETGRS
jgi:hypothetical protein